MNPKIGKITTLFTALMIALLFTGVGYAMWQKTLTITTTVNTGKLDWEIKGPMNNMDDGEDYNANCTWDFWLAGKDVGSTSLTPEDTDGDGDCDVLHVTISNAYPWYAEEISFYVHNDGSIPLIIEKVVIDGQEFWSGWPTVFLDLSGDGTNDVKVRYGDNLGAQLHYCEQVEISISILVLQGAPQDTTLTFDVSLVAIQYNEYNPP